MGFLLIAWRRWWAGWSCSWGPDVRMLQQGDRNCKNMLPDPKFPGRRFLHLSLPLRHLHRMQVVFRRDLLHGFHPLECLKCNPRFELRTVVSSLLFHVSVGFGYTPETLQKLTISLAPFQRTTSQCGGIVQTNEQFGLASGWSLQERGHEECSICPHCSVR